jgi:hypothetical protein
MKTATVCILLVLGVIIVSFSVADQYRERKHIIDAFTLQRAYDVPRGWKDIGPEVFKETITPAGTSENSTLSPDAANASYLALPLPAMGEQEALNNWGTVTSQRCLSLDQSEALRSVNKTTNLLQRTNTYPPEHPDSCSAPSHEFLATFYKPAGAIRATPLAGTTFPPSTQCA